MIEVLRSLAIADQAPQRWVPRGWATLFGIGFAIGIAAGAFFG
jgi:hypothetical protein